jgi:hypothetical protein
MLANYQEQINANTKTMLAEIMEKMEADSKAWREEMEARRNGWRKETVETRHREFEEPTSADMKACQETTVCHEATETDIEKIGPDSGMMQSVAEHQEVPREDAAVMPVRQLRKQRRGRKQAAGRREEPKELNRGICGSREKLAATCRKVSHRATVAWRKMNILRKFWTQRNCGLRKEVTAAGMRITRCAGHRRKGQNKDDVERETRKGTFEKKLWKGSDCNNDIRNRGLRQQLQGKNAVKDLGGGRPRYLRKRELKMLQLESTGNLDTTFRKTTRLGIAKRIAGSVVALQRIKKWTLWRGRPPPKRKKKQH